MDSRFTYNEDLAVTDSKTGLMWATKLFGKNSRGDIDVYSEDADGLSWWEATKRFGRARKLKHTPLIHYTISNIGEIDNIIESYALRPEIYHRYRLGYDSFEYAEFKDWRLPTVEELVSLVDFSQEDDGYGLRMCKFLLKCQYEKLETVWTSNRWGWLNQYECAWSMSIGFNSKMDCGLDADTSPSAKAPLILVRKGNVFENQNITKSFIKPRTIRRYKYRSSPFILRSPFKNFVVSYLMTEEEVLVVKSFVGIKYGERSAARLANITRVHATGLLWGDIVFGEGSATPVVWQNVYRPERVLRRVKELIGNDAISSH